MSVSVRLWHSWPVAALAAMLVLAVLFAPRVTGGMRDFEVYYTAAQRAAAGDALYRVEDEHYQFKYLPAFAVLSRPAARLSLQTAKTVWFAASIVLLHLMILTSVRLLPDRRAPTWLLVVVVVVAMGKFYGHELVLGQVNLLLGAVVTTAALALTRGLDVPAGTLLAVAMVVKPYAVLFLPWITAQRRWRAASVAAVGSLLALALPVPAYGLRATVDLHREWWTTVTESTAPNLLNQDNVSLAAMFAKWLGPGSAATTLATGSAIGLLAVAGVVFTRRSGVRAPEALEAALLLTLLPLLSPQGWDYVFLLSTPAVVILANYRNQLPPWLRVLSAIALATIGLSLFDILGRARYAEFMAWSIITVCFLIVIGGLAWLRVRRVA